MHVNPSTTARPAASSATAPTSAKDKTKPAVKFDDLLKNAQAAAPASGQALTPGLPAATGATPGSAAP